MSIEEALKEATKISLLEEANQIEEDAKATRMQGVLTKSPRLDSVDQSTLVKKWTVRHVVVSQPHKLPWGSLFF